MKGNTHIADYLKLLYNATAIANVADNAASSPLTNVKAALHTADPGSAGSQTTSAAAYTGYAQVNVARTTGGFTISGQSVTLAAAVSFSAGATTDTDVITHFSFGDGTKIWHSAPIGSSLGVGTAVAATDIITIPGLTGVSVGDRITFYAPLSGTIPTGITVGTIYFVKTVSSNDITISTTNGGSVLDITAAGDVHAWKVTPITMGGGLVVTPQLGTGTTITEK